VLFRSGPLEASEKQDLARRFAEGYKHLLLMTGGNPPEEWLALQERLEAYRRELKDLGLKDHQVLALQGEHLGDMDVNTDKVLSTLQIPYQILHFCLLIALAAVPMLLLNLPVAIMAGIYAERRRKKALANSKVKVRGYDVMLTEKVVFCIVMVPALWLVYGCWMVFFTELDGPTVTLLFFSMPLFAYMAIIVAEAGMVDIVEIRPFFMRLLPRSRLRLAALPQTRKKLQDDLRDFIRAIGPALGAIYHHKDLDWKHILEASPQLKGKIDESKKIK